MDRSWHLIASRRWADVGPVDNFGSGGEDADPGSSHGTVETASSYGVHTQSGNEHDGK
jgi:hypothetical protein